MARGVATRFQSHSARGSRLILLLMAVLSVYGCLSVNSSDFIPPIGASDPQSIDSNLYRAVADRVRAGEGYYKAAGAELRSRGYATRPFFNWRLPLLADIIGRLPSTDAALPVAIAVAGLVLLVWLIVLARQEIPIFVIVTLLLLVRGLLAAVIPPAFLFHELWAGMLIALSIGLHGLGWRRASITAGLLALFIRELVLPFAVVMLAIAWYEKHRREAWTWAAGIAAFAVFLGVHALHVNSLITAADRAHEGWLHCNGWGFVLATGKFNTLLVNAPQWVLALAMPAAMLGLVAWRGPTGLRAAATVGTYMCAFLIAGRACNFYWGMLYAPLLSLGLAYSPWALLDLLRSAGIIPRTPRPSQQTQKAPADQTTQEPVPV